MTVFITSNLRNIVERFVWTCFNRQKQKKRTNQLFVKDSTSNKV